MTRALRGGAFLVALLALAVVAPPVAEAHIETFTQAAPIRIGPYTAIVEPRPNPMYANSALSVSAIFSRASDGTYPPADTLDPTLRLTGPGTNKTTKMTFDGTGYFLAAAAVTEPGEYVAEIVVTDGAGSYANTTNLTAYPDLPFRIRTADPLQSDPLVGRPFRIGIETVSPDSLRRIDAMTDLTLTLEHWSDDHRELFGVERHPLTRAELGVWERMHTFESKGMYHLLFSSASARFNESDVPILHVYATLPLDDGDAERSIPAPAWGFVALVLAAMLLRRR